MKNQLCFRCGELLGRKKPNKVCTVWLGKCDACGERKEVIAKEDFGIYDEPDKDVKKLMNLFNIKL